MEATKVTLQHELDEATSKGEEINEIVKNWLTDADNISETVDRFLNDDEGQLVKTGCSSTNYLFPNLVLRHRLSKKAKKMTQSVTEINVACKSTTFLRPHSATQFRKQRLYGLRHKKFNCDRNS